MSDQPRMIQISCVRVSPRLQCRVQLDKQSLTDFIEAVRKGDAFPPVVVFRIENDLWLVDGHHRFESARKAGGSEILAIVHNGTWHEAVRAALAANRSHGVRLTTADREKAVLLARQEFPDYSDRALAELCGVSYKTVGRVLKQSVGTMSQLPQGRRGRDGKLYPARRRAVSSVPTAPTGDSILPTESDPGQTCGVALSCNSPSTTARPNSAGPNVGGQNSSSKAAGAPVDPANALSKSPALQPAILVRNYVNATIRHYPTATSEIETVLKELLIVISTAPVMSPTPQTSEIRTEQTAR